MLFSDKKLHPQTVRGWIKKEGLSCIKDSEWLIFSGDLKEFLKKRNQTGKVTMSLNEFNCLSCQKIITPTSDSITVTKRTNGTYNVKSICPKCSKLVCRLYKAIDLKKLKNSLNLKRANNQQLKTIDDSVMSCTKTHSKISCDSSQSESKNIGLNQQLSLL